MGRSYLTLNSTCFGIAHSSFGRFISSNPSVKISQPRTPNAAWHQACVS
jgi:hypothetical protein